MPEGSKGRRQTRVPGGRRQRIVVKVTAQDAQDLEKRAAAAGLSVPAWLVAAGLAGRTSGGGEGLQLAGMSARERRAWAAEFVGARRLLRGVATNINQLAAGMNATGEVGEQLGAVLDLTRRVTARLDVVMTRLEGHAPASRAERPEDLKRSA